uniref:Uncharacterized protein n=1 Tax=Rhizophora mucronata TaxID=61149 RepID=A0A2P2QK41_RHIMU
MNSFKHSHHCYFHVFDMFLDNPTIFLIEFTFNLMLICVHTKLQLNTSILVI